MNFSWANPWASPPLPAVESCRLDPSDASPAKRCSKQKELIQELTQSSCDKTATRSEGGVHDDGNNYKKVNSASVISSGEEVPRLQLASLTAAAPATSKQPLVMNLLQGARRAINLTVQRPSFPNKKKRGKAGGAESAAKAPKRVFLGAHMPTDLAIDALTVIERRGLRAS